MKTDIFYYIMLVISIMLFIITNVLLEPVELLDEDVIEDTTTSEIYTKGLENINKVKERYKGNLNIDSKSADFILLFTNYKLQFVEDYEKYNKLEESDEKYSYENIVYQRYGIKTQEERDKLYNYFKTLSDIVKIEVDTKTINTLDDSIIFSIVATDDQNLQHRFACTIYNESELSSNYLKLLPEENQSNSDEGE